ncbi:hypothetical protein Syun_012615 [Stephania yunnanensis]|uniref:Uncharacterized protein n=1 Tax=Stephania yunnanensis TaxID=152371 RepID=A0AAP0PJ47_9MAGN
MPRRLISNKPFTNNFLNGFNKPFSPSKPIYNVPAKPFPAATTVAGDPPPPSSQSSLPPPPPSPISP